MADRKSASIFVLVHGAWHGGWCWRRVAGLLTGRGHRVFAPTLTGLGERVHLLSPAVGLDTHMSDIVNVLKFEQLSNFVLAGHSYAGAVISGVAEQAFDQISSIVFLDAFMPADGEAARDAWPPAMQILREKEAAQSGGLSIPPPPAAFFKVNEKDQPLVNSLMVPHPYKTFTDKCRHSGARERIAKKTYAFSPVYNAPYFRANYERLKNDPAWKVFEVPCGHDMMLDMPERTADILEAAA
jgi:pimeloyl-ACP methyl ester carboxylesterase